MIRELTCRVCGTVFSHDVRGGVPKVCSPECSRRWQTRESLRREHEKAEARRAIERACAYCGGKFTGNVLRKYCSAICKSRAYNDARRADGRLKSQRARRHQRDSSMLRRG